MRFQALLALLMACVAVPASAQPQPTPEKRIKKLEEEMRAVLDSLRCRYPDRYLFLDGPAIKGSPDARILSELADFVVLVAGYGRDTPAAIAQAAAAFDPNRFAGVVFNQLP